MQELVKLLMEKTGISEETAKMAIEVVANFTKEKLPDPVGGMVRQFLQTGKMPDVSTFANLAGNFGATSNLLSGFSSMLGKL